MEMGIAMPYMEEEVKLLTDGTLLKKVDNDRYKTDFIIVDKTMQLDIFHKLVEVSEQFCPMLIELLDRISEKIRKVDFIGSQMEAEELYWTLIPMTVDGLSGKTNRLKQVPQGYTNRPHQGKWDIVGYEECKLPFNVFVGHNGNGNEKEIMWAYKIRMKNLWDRAGELSSYEASILADAIRFSKSLDALGHIEKEVIRSLMEKGFVKKAGTKLTRHLWF
jgi:hypothetical protein